MNPVKEIEVFYLPIWLFLHILCIWGWKVSFLVNFPGKYLVIFDIFLGKFGGLLRNLEIVGGFVTFTIRKR